MRRFLHLLISAALAVMALPLMGQDDLPLFPQQEDSLNTMCFLHIQAGAGTMLLRDQGTSPLFFSGEALFGGLAIQWISKRWELQLQTDVGFGILQSQLPEDVFFSALASSEVFHGNFEAIYLRSIKPNLFAKMDYKIGGGVQAGVNIRSTPAFLNNGTGVEGFGHLLMAASATRDISRKQTKIVKVWFVKLHFKPVQQRIGIQIQGGILNANYRPGYAYRSLPEIDGPLGGIDRQLVDHQWSLNGWRLGSRILYTRFTKRGNGHQVGYHWNALHAPGAFEPFDMAQHRLLYTLLFN